MTPSEAVAAINAGHASKLTHVISDGGYAVVLPLMVDEHGRTTSVPGTGSCIFLTGRGRCALHGTDYKPIQYRLTFGCRRGAPPEAETETVEALWESVAGVAAFRSLLLDLRKDALQRAEALALEAHA